VCLPRRGIVGTFLFAGFVVAAALAVARGSGFTDGAARAGVAAAVYFALHGSGDWLWEFPGLAAPAFAWLGLAASRPVAAQRSAVFRIGVAVGAALVAASFLFPWLAELESRRALQLWMRDPAAAYHDLARARSLNPLSAQPDVLAGAIASRRNDIRRMAASFAGAAGRTPDDWYAHFELALAYDALGKRQLALAELAEARRLNPREAEIPIVARAVATNRQINRDQIDRFFVERVRTRVGP
jgi:tetratricopeptide (TPR) repeat protein